MEEQGGESKLGVAIFIATIVLCSLIIYYISAPPPGPSPHG